MSNEPEGVIPSATPTDPDPNDASGAPAAAVPAVGDEVIGDRPVRNVIAELDRKMAQRFDQFRAELLAAQLPSRPSAPQARDYSDEELSQLATAGDARALQTLTDRQAARHAAQQQQVASQAQTEQAEVAALYSRYAVLNDESHQLTQYAMRVKAALIARGAPNTYGTVRDAILRAIADNPQLVAPVATPTPRPSAPTSQSSAPSPRRTPAAPSNKTTTLTDEQWEVAKRYGYKTREDAAKAIDRTKQRRQTGQSGLGAIQMYVREN